MPNKIPSDTQWADLASKVKSKLNITDYSTSEQDTGVKWVDNRTIYKKTIDWGWMPNNARVDKDHQIPNNCLTVNIEAMAYRPDGYAMHTMPYMAVGGTTYDTVFMADGTTGKLSIATNSDRSGWKAYVTVYYCKPSS